MLMVSGGWQRARGKHRTDFPVVIPCWVSISCLFLLFSLTKLNTLLHHWKESWALGLDHYGYFYDLLCDPFKVVWFQQVNGLSCNCIEIWKPFPSVRITACLCCALQFEGEVASRLKALTFCLFLFVLGPRATSECPSAQDAGFGGSADHAAGELPGVLHTRYAVHHGRVAHRAGLLRSGRHELSWYLIWWGSRQVSGSSLLRV